MQLMDGGSTDRNIQRLMEAQAQVATGSRSGNGATLAVGDVYRDEKGGIWRDQDEELEYQHLLGGARGAADGDGDGHSYEWVTFGEDGKAKELEREIEAGDADPSLALASLAGVDLGLGRRDSITSMKTVDSDLDPTNVIKPADEDAGMMLINVPGLMYQAAPQTQTVLSIPIRPTQSHLRKTPHFILDLAAFSPTSPHHPRTPRTPLTPGFTYKRTSPVRNSFSSGTSAPRLRGKARRRPAPLDLKLVDAPGACVSRMDVSTSASGDHDVILVEQGRRDFIDASFAPAPLPLGLAPPPPRLGMGLGGLKAQPQPKKKRSRIGFALFGRRE